MGLSCPSYLRDRLFVAKRKTFGFKADNFGEVGVMKPLPSYLFVTGISINREFLLMYNLLIINKLWTFC